MEEDERAFRFFKAGERGRLSAPPPPAASRRHPRGGRGLRAGRAHVGAVGTRRGARGRGRPGAGALCGGAGPTCGCGPKVRRPAC
jgi:hypothetical protein